MSTDEQMRQDCSLIEQEERLLKYCEINNLRVTAIFTEDYSAKDFNRPEWKQLSKTIKKNRNKPSGKIIFLKWDCFSRNIQFAYQMIGILKALNIEPMAIDQPIDFDIPESIVMLAVYLSIPDAENSRRRKNTSDGMRRVKKIGRWPGKAPIGYTNTTPHEGRCNILIFCIDSLPTVLYPNFLNCIISEFLNMETVNYPMCAYKTPFYRQLHIGCHIHGYFPVPVFSVFRKSFSVQI